ncbi:hypothetical protein LXL04_038905 [Taraxacum kok-saghyz]
MEDDCVAHEHFKIYKMSQIVGILKANEEEIREMVKNLADVGALALVAKEIDLSLHRFCDLQHFVRDDSKDGSVVGCQ